MGCNNKSAVIQKDIQSLDLLRGDLILCSGDEFGKSGLAFNCDISVQKTFSLAVSLLHSFEYNEAERAFVNIIDVDPDCAMAYWGVAMSMYHALWFKPGEIELEKGSKILEIASTLPKTNLEQDYLDAINSYYKDWNSVDHTTRAKNMTQNMALMYEKYPTDTEVAIFYALAIKSTADRTDKTYASEKKAGKILESIFPDQPNHPGIAHYIIHNYDNPALAHLALPVARKYADIAPASAHAQHMPSHIFTRLGLWNESILANINSATSAKCYAEESDMKGTWDQEIHAIAYLVYAHLQQGDNIKANEQYEYVKTMQLLHRISPVAAYPFVAIPARIALENKLWQDAAYLEMHDTDLNLENFPWQKSMLHFTRAIGSSHMGDIQSAEIELATIKELHADIQSSGNTYLTSQVIVQIKTASAWIEFAKNNQDLAVSLMEEAVTLEDQTSKHPVTPGELIPTRELLGDMLLELKRPKDALAAYEENMVTHPNRFNSLYGAAIASRTSNIPQKTRYYFEQLLQLSNGVGSNRPEIGEARNYVSQHI